MGKVIIIDGDRVTIPIEFRELLNLKKGDILEYQIEEGKLILKYNLSEDPTKELFGLAADVKDDIEGDDLFLKELQSKK